MDLSRLNPEQQQAVKRIDGPLLVLAGAGTGKTTVITHRIGWMLKCGVQPENIIALTFTNKAAAEMKNRVKALLPGVKQQNLFVGTFHAFGNRILRKHISSIGYTGKFGIADEGDQLGLIKQVMDHHGFSRSELKPDYFKNSIHRAKNYLRSVDNTDRAFSGDNAQLLATVYGDYQRRLQSMNLVDFDDLIFLPVKLWQENPDILEMYRNQYRYILVDEYQDTNFAQAELIRLLAGEKKNVCVVGDDDQSIYGWRGAEIANILNFPSVFKDSQVVKLEQNYRSTDVILSAANQVIGNNACRHGKSLWSADEKGELIKIFEVHNEPQEAKLVTDLIQHFKYEKHMDYEETAILFRSNFQTRIFEQTLRAHQIPYRLIGAKAFYERKEVKDALAYLKIVHNRYDDLSLLRILNVPPRGIGDSTINKLKLYKESTGKCFMDILKKDEFLQTLSGAAANQVRAFSIAVENAWEAFSGQNTLAETIQTYLNNVGYLSEFGQIYKKHEERVSRMENIQEFINSATLLRERLSRDLTLQDFLEINTLMDDQDRTTDQTRGKNGVILLTVHSAKGMEFTNVIIVGMEQGLFPHERSIKDRALEEERRLFYVALTRAKKNVVLTRTKIRTKYNTKTARTQSAFLAELPPECVTTGSAEELLKPAAAEHVESVFEALRERFS